MSEKISVSVISAWRVLIADISGIISPRTDNPTLAVGSVSLGPKFEFD